MKTLSDATGADWTTAAGFPLLRILARASGRQAPASTPGVTICERCETRYFTRPEGSALPENGCCRACATEEKSAAVVQISRPRRSRR